MSGMFAGSEFNGDISNWDVGNVHDMSGMFADSEFNGDISKWNTSKVQYMNYLFERAEFNGDISRWNTSNVNTLNCAFFCSKFQGDLSEWDVSQVTNMAYALNGTPFAGDLSKWDVSKVEKFEGMLYATPFQGDLSNWNVLSYAKLTRMLPLHYLGAVSPSLWQRMDEMVSNKKDLTMYFEHHAASMGMGRAIVARVLDINTKPRFMDKETFSKIKATQRVAEGLEVSRPDLIDMVMHEMQGALLFPAHTPEMNDFTESP